MRKGKGGISFSKGFCDDEFISHASSDFMIGVSFLVGMNFDEIEPSSP